MSALEDCDRLLREGRVREASQRFLRVSLARVPRALRLPYARVARRCGLSTHGLRLLTPIVFERTREKATAEEWAEYAVLLQRSGVVEEALAILGRPDVAAIGSTALARALCYFNVWDYEAALPSLHAYLAQDLPEYDRFIGETNLAAALVATSRESTALSLLDRNISLLREKNHKRLLGNSLHLRALTHYGREDFELAKQDLNLASAELGDVSTLDRFFVKKWLAAIEARETRDSSPLLAIREEARRLRHFESVREAELLALKVKFNRAAFAHLYFGTPALAYRERLLRDLDVGAPEGNFVLGDPASKRRLVVAEGSDLLPTGSKLHQLVEILFRDFYRPLNVGAIFASLYPDERFDIETSPDRVHQILRRTRKQLGAKSGLEIREHDGLYEVRRAPGFAVIVSSQRASATWEAIQLRRLETNFSAREFTSREARVALGLSIAHFRRLSIWARDGGRLEKSRATKASSYRLIQIP